MNTVSPIMTTTTDMPTVEQFANSRLNFEVNPDLPVLLKFGGDAPGGIVVIALDFDGANYDKVDITDPASSYYGRVEMLDAALSTLSEVRDHVARFEALRA